MNVTKKQERIIHGVLNGWEQRGDISRFIGIYWLKS